MDSIDFGLTRMNNSIEFKLKVIKVQNSVVKLVMTSYKHILILIHGTYKYITSNGKSDFADATEIEKESESEVTPLCLTLCVPMDHSLPGSLSMGFSRQEFWSGLPFPSPGDLPDPGNGTQVSHIVGRCFTV